MDFLYYKQMIISYDLFIWVGWFDWQSFFDDELSYLPTYLLRLKPD